MLDEADRMLDMGFIHDIKKVLAVRAGEEAEPALLGHLQRRDQGPGRPAAEQAGADRSGAPQPTAETIAQKVHPVGRERKKELLAHLIKSGDWHQVLVFTRMKHGANRLTEYLNDHGISAMAIHGNKSQTARTKALADFKTGDLQVLVATDIAARGIDIDQLPHVVNFELPNVPEDYVHRIGRTGRAGASGEAISLVCVDEDIFLRDIERLIKRSIPREVVPGFEPPAEREGRADRARPHDHRRRRHAPQRRWRWCRRAHGQARQWWRTFASGAAGTPTPGQCRRWPAIRHPCGPAQALTVGHGAGTGRPHRPAVLIRIKGRRQAPA